MRPALIQLILLAKVHQKVSRRVKGQLQVDKVGNKLAGSVEYDVLGEHFADSHRLNSPLLANILTLPSTLI